MIPILFEGNETSFTSNGIGRLSDAITCVVTENRNGAYELEMKYPIDGVHFEDIIHGRYILAKPAKYTQNQPFEIYKISKPVNGVCTICAYHISYRLSMIPVMPFSTNSITAALNGLKTNAAEQNPFNFSTTKTTVANYNQTEPRDARSCLGGVQGSILDVFGGGEYEFDMFDVKLWQNRGQNRGFEIRYGKNLIDLKQETNIENTITGIVPYYKNESTTITLPEKVIETASAANFPYPRSVPVDLSSEFQETVPTVAQLRAAGNAYIASHEIGVPKVSLTVSFVNLADTKGYEDIAVLEDIRLCDTVRVVFDKLGVNALAKVISTEYDTLKEKFTKIELGSSSTTLANRIAAQEKATEEQTSALQDAINRATNLITGVSGGYVVMHTGNDGKPYEILIMDNEDINQAVHVWRWNKNGWGYSSDGYNGTYRLAATIDGGIVADFIKAGILTGIEINNGNGTFHVDSAGNMKATSGEFIGEIKSGSSINCANKFIVDAAGNMTATSASLISESENKSVTIQNGWVDCITYGNALTGFTAKRGNQKFDIHSQNINGYNNNGINTIIISNTEGGSVICYNPNGTSYSMYGSTICSINGTLSVSGSKSRIVKTKDYNERLLYCYETPSPMFGDMGEGKTDETGICEVWLDDIFGETIDLDIKYQVFLQMYSEGALRVTERNSMFFRVEGTPNASFGWELKAVQRDYDTIRLEEYQEPEEQEEDQINETYNYLESLLYDVEGEVA